MWNMESHQNVDLQEINLTKFPVSPLALTHLLYFQLPFLAVFHSRKQKQSPKKPTADH